MQSNQGPSPAGRPDPLLEARFEEEVLRLPPDARAQVLAWLRHWRRRPGRIFWEVTATGEWRRV